MKSKESAAPNIVPHDNAAAHKETSRTPWMGGLDEEEMQRPGGVLLSMLLSHANRQGHTLAQMSDAMNVAYSYVSQLRNGHRKVVDISSRFVTAAASYLGVPRMTVMVAAGQILPTDVYENPTEVIGSAERAIEFIQDDEHFGPMMPPEALTASIEMKFFIVQLYERATNRKLIPGSHDAVSMAKEIESWRKYAEGLKQQVMEDRAVKAIKSKQRKDTKEIANSSPSDDET